MAIQRFKIAPYMEKHKNGAGVFYADHLEDKATALAEQREGIAEMVDAYFKDDKNVYIAGLYNRIRAFGGEEEA